MGGGYESDITEKEIKKEGREKNENGKEIERWVGARRAFSTASAANSAIV